MDELLLTSQSWVSSSSAHTHTITHPHPEILLQYENKHLEKHTFCWFVNEERSTIYAQLLLKWVMVCFSIYLELTCSGCLNRRVSTEFTCTCGTLELKIAHFWFNVQINMIEMFSENWRESMKIRPEGTNYQLLDMVILEVFLNLNNSIIPIFVLLQKHQNFPLPVRLIWLCVVYGCSTTYSVSKCAFHHTTEQNVIKRTS